MGRLARSWALTASWTAILLLLAQGAPAENRGIPLNPGDRATTAIDPPGDVDTFVFDAFEGTLFSFVLGPARGSGLVPVVEILNPSGARLDLESRAKRKGNRITVKKLRLPATGRYAIRVGGADGTEGAFDLKTGGSRPGKLRWKGVVIPAGEVRTFPFGATTGSKVKVSVKAGGAEFEVVSVLGPAGTEMPGGTEAFASRGKGVGATLFPGLGFGDYAVVVGNLPVEAAVSVSIRAKHPTAKKRKLEIGALEPVPTEVEPAVGQGGDAVTIHGANFREGEIVVLVSDRPATKVTFVSGDRITARVPWGDLGPATVVVYNPDGQDGTLPDGFEYIPEPIAVAGMTPLEGPDTGGTVVEITGPNAGNASVVAVGGVDLADPPEVLAADRVRFTTEAHAPGAAPVVLRDEWGQEVRAPDFTFVGVPEVRGLVPSLGRESGGTRVTLSGARLRADSRVFLGGVEAPAVEYVDAAHLVLTTPAHAPGIVDLRVEDPWGRAATLARAFEFVDVSSLAGTFFDVTEDRLPANETDDQFGADLEMTYGGPRISLGDLDGDDDLDVLLAGAPADMTYLGYTLFDQMTQVLLNDGKGAFAARYWVYCPLIVNTEAAVLGDLDGDADLDLVAAGSAIYRMSWTEQYTWIYMKDGPVAATRVLHNDGNANFTYGYVLPDPVRERIDVLQGQALALGDVDGDDDLDLVVTHGRRPAVSDWTDSSTTRTFTLDYDTDRPATRLFLNDGAGCFTDATGDSIPAETGGDIFAGDEVMLADVDGDDDLDIVLTGDSSRLRDSGADEYVAGSKTRILTNDGEGVFENSTESLLPATGAGDDWGGVALAFGDLDGDGYGDLVVALNRPLRITESGGTVHLPSTRIFTGSATGKFTESTASLIPAVRADGQGELWMAADVAIADPDGNGTADLFLVSDEGVKALDPASGEVTRQVSSTRWLRGVGKSSLVDSTSTGMPDLTERKDYLLGQALALGDLDGDSDLDLVLTTGAEAYRGDGKHPTRLLEFVR